MDPRFNSFSIQRLGRGTFCQSAQRTLAYRDSRLDTLNVNLGGSVSRLDLNARLLGPGAHSDMLGLYFGDEDQHFDHNTSQDHIAPDTGSDLLYKGALDDRSRAAFPGDHSGTSRRSGDRRVPDQPETCCFQTKPEPTRFRTSKSRPTT